MLKDPIVWFKKIHETSFILKFTLVGNYFYTIQDFQVNDYIVFSILEEFWQTLDLEVFICSFQHVWKHNYRREHFIQVWMDGFDLAFAL